MFPAWRITQREAKERGYTSIVIPAMGDYRFYFCERGILNEELIAEYMPDHGLLWFDGRAIRTVRPAPKREMVDKDSEIRYLRFAIINRKNSFGTVTCEKTNL